VQVAARLAVSERSRSRDVLAGQSVHIAGRLTPGRAGRLIRLQGRRAHGWQTLADARTGAHGGFSIAVHPDSGFARHLRVRFSGDRANAATTLATGDLTVYSTSVASWYEDGGSTGCGFHAGLGVANRTLPCGTRVRFRYGGRTVEAVVDDRGPYVGGRDWDLNQTTAGDLGFAGVGQVWDAVQSES
jgi:hypothetical protein